MFRLLLIALVSLISFSLVLGMFLVVFGVFDGFQIVFSLICFLIVFGFVWVVVGFVFFWLLGFFVLFYFCVTMF